MSHRMNKKALRQARFNRAEDKLSLMIPGFEQHTISLLVSNKPGVLMRIAQVFSRRGYNLESVVVSPTKDNRFSRMSLVATGDRETLDQIIKQLNKLVDVIHARDHTGEDKI